MAQYQKAFGIFGFVVVNLDVRVACWLVDVFLSVFGSTRSVDLEIM